MAGALPFGASPSRASQARLLLRPLGYGCSAIYDAAMEGWVLVNLYSKIRGGNPFCGL